MRALFLACVFVALPRLATADDVPAPTEPLVEPIPTAETEKPPEPRENYEKPALKTPIRPREIVITVPGVRTKQQKIVLGSLFAASAIGAAVGAYFHLGSRSAANDVSETVFNGQTWTPELNDRFDDGERAKTRAAVGYAVGGAILIGAIVTLIVTEPKSEKAVIRPRHAGVVPVPGGAVAGAGWSF